MFCLLSPIQIHEHENNYFDNTTIRGNTSPFVRNKHTAQSPETFKDLSENPSGKSENPLMICRKIDPTSEPKLCERQSGNNDDIIL